MNDIYGVDYCMHWGWSKMDEPIKDITGYSRRL